MEPRIQYAKTSDGVSIAFWTLGEGPPVVFVPGLSSHCDLELQNPQIREFYDRLGQNRQVVRYDGRGTGLSDRDATDFSLDARMLDLEAVADYLGFRQFDLFAGFTAGPVGIAYAARQPERVSRLLLWCAYARGADVSGIPSVQGLLGLADKDWVLYTEAVAHAALGWSDGEQAQRLAAVMRASSNQEIVRLAATALFDVNVTDQLPGVRSPTLVLHRRDSPLPLQIARGLASAMPSARMALLEGSSLSLFSGDMEPVLAAIDAFLAEGEEATPTAQAPPASGAFRTVLFTDLVGHTEMMSRLGDERGRAVLREHERITRDVLKAHGGTEVKTMGDGFMASFGSVTKAVECAIALQQAMDDRNRSVGAHHDATLRVRCGLNAGEPIEEDGDLFGATVILAARIAAKAEGGEILVADTVRGLCSGKRFLFADRGEFVAKGFEEPVRVYEVRWSFDSPSASAEGGSG